MTHHKPHVPYQDGLHELLPGHCLGRLKSEKAMTDPSIGRGGEQTGQQQSEGGGLQTGALKVDHLGWAWGCKGNMVGHGGMIVAALVYI